MPRPLNQTDTDLNADNLLRLAAEFGCPVWVYDAQIVRERSPPCISLTWCVLPRRRAPIFIFCA